ncbi:MAG: DUF975 family protein [Eubacterium sp.]|nr:DUF975 family protein [Eubacterium sp.]
MWTRAGLKNRAREVFTANYWKALLAALLLGIVASGGDSSGFLSGIFTGGMNYGTISAGDDAFQFSGMAGFGLGFLAAGIIITIVIIGLAIFLVMDIFLFKPLEVGIRKFYYTNLHQKAELKELAAGFDHSYMNVVKIMFFRGLYTFLWSLLFVIPGIVKSYEYRMIPYLLAEHPEMSMEEAFAISRNMMDGNKWKAFVLDWSFILWEFLSAVTLGIVGIFYVNPYVAQTSAALYDALKIEKNPFAGENAGFAGQNFSQTGGFGQV